MLIFLLKHLYCASVGKKKKKNSEKKNTAYIYTLSCLPACEVPDGSIRASSVG